MNDELENKINKLQIDRSDWELVKFGDVAKQQKKTVDRDSTELTKYVKGEHMASEDLHIREYGELTDEYLGPAFIRKFEKGDILYGSRRTYLRKVAIAHFDGITSNTTFVIKANDKKIDKRLLPFIMLSEGFAENSIRNSKGSVNPYINWKDIADYEFLLPPKDQQAQLAELLWAMDEVIEKEMGVLKSLEKGFKSFRELFIENGLNQTTDSRKERFAKISSKWRTAKLSSFCQLIGGNAFKSNNFKIQGKYQVLRIGNITNAGFDLTKAPVFIDDISESEIKYLIPSGAIVLSLTGTNGKRDYGFPCLMEEHNKHLLNQRLVMIIPDSSIMIPDFLFLLAKMELFQGRFFLNAIGTANQANVSIHDVSQIKLPIPEISEQMGIVEKINNFRYGLLNIEFKINSSQALQKSLINQIF
ncbi:MAG: restriction endonuclease subunit S [Bacteroidales bacterium]